MSRRSVFRLGRKDKPVEPVTLMGLFMRATMLRWEDDRQRLSAEVKRTGSVDGNSVIRAAFEVAVRRRFRPGADLREISSFVNEMRKAFGEKTPVLETEAMIRHALGEDVPVDDIGEWLEIGGKVPTLMGVKDVLALDESGVNAILVEAEAIARQRGFRPTLADQDK